MLNPENILIRMPNWLGDAVMATPLIADLRNHYPSARITVMCLANVAPLFELDDQITEILSFKKLNGWIHGQSRDIINPLRYGNFDLGILTTNSFSSAWWFWLGNVKNIIGFSTNFRSLLLDMRIPFPKNKEIQHQVLTYKELLTPLMIPISSTMPYLKVSEKEKYEAKNLLENLGINTEKNIVIGINPGAAFGSAKCWLPARFKELTMRLIEDPNIRVIYFGDQNTSNLVASICKDLPNTVINLAKKTTLRELMALIASCSVILSNDSGPMHIAAAFGKKIISVWGNTVPEFGMYPYLKKGSGQSVIIENRELNCRPCSKIGYQKCPKKHFKCMNDLDMNELALQAEKLWNS